MHLQFRFAALVLCVTICIVVQFAEANKAKKIVKAVAKNAILPRHHGRRFPIWGIILLVLGVTGMIGLGIFLFCFFRRRLTQTQSFI